MPTPPDAQSMLARYRQRMANEEKVCPGLLARAADELHEFTQKTLRQEGVDDPGEVHQHTRDTGLHVVAWIFTPPRPGSYPCVLTFTCEPQGLTARREIAGLHTPRRTSVERLPYDHVGDTAEWIKTQILAFLDHALRAN